MRRHSFICRGAWPHANEGINLLLHLRCVMDTGGQANMPLECALKVRHKNVTHLQCVSQRQPSGGQKGGGGILWTPRYPPAGECSHSMTHLQGALPLLLKVQSACFLSVKHRETLKQPLCISLECSATKAAQVSGWPWGFTFFLIHKLSLFSPGALFKRCTMAQTEKVHCIHNTSPSSP